MKNFIDNKGRYVINTDWCNLSLQERKDIYILLMFLNSGGNVLDAFEQLKRNWLDQIQPIIGDYGTPKYNNSTSARYNTSKRLKRLFAKYITKVK